MPTDVARPSKNNNKFSRIYALNEGAVTIWYKGNAKPNDNQFARLVRSLRLARIYVNKAVQVLGVTPLSKLAKDVLGVHFGAYNTQNQRIGNFFEEIRESFEEIQQGLSTQVILCLEKDLGNERGETMRHGKTKKHMHLNLNLLHSNDESAIARTIIHEASHMFAKMPGTSTYEDGQIEKELYESNLKYRAQKPKTAKSCADSYAWAALSLAHGHVVCSDLRWEDPVTNLYNDTFDNFAGCSHQESRNATLISRWLMGPRSNISDLRRSGVLRS